jgi:hypothetical protein
MMNGEESKAKLVLKSWDSGVRTCSNELGEVDSPGLKTMSPSRSLLKATATILSFLRGFGRGMKESQPFNSFWEFVQIF